MINPNETLNAAASLLREVAPIDLAGKPIYRFDSGSTHGSGIRRSCGDWWAWTGAALDLELERWLRARGWWAGRGPCIVFDLSRIAANRSSSTAFLEAVLGIALHELSHWLAGGQLAHCTLEEMPPVIQDALKTEFWVRDPGDDPPVREPWDQHGKSFIRACCHLRYRALRFAHEGVIQQITFAGDTYGVSAREAYFAALGDEPHRHRGESIREILDTPAPDGFRELWERDTAAWHLREASRLAAAGNPAGECAADHDDT